MAEIAEGRQLDAFGGDFTDIQRRAVGVAGVTGRHVFLDDLEQAQAQLQSTVVEAQLAAQLIAGGDLRRLDGVAGINHPGGAAWLVGA